MKLSENFWLSEFTHSQEAKRHGIDNTPPGNVLKNLEDVAGYMERIRTVLGNHPVIISSGYRCPELNKVVGGSVGSFHMLGLAVDFTVRRFGTPLEVCKAIVGAGLRFDQIIHEYGDDGWVHIGFNAGASVWRMQQLSAYRNKEDKTVYIPGLVPV